jgi:hypothetical protein
VGLNAGTTAKLFDHLVGAGENGRGDFDTERFRRLEINDKQEFGGLLNRKPGRFGAFQNSIDPVEPRRESPARKKSIRPLCAKLLIKENDGKPACNARSGTRFGGVDKIGSAHRDNASARALAAAMRRIRLIQLHGLHAETDA